MTPQEIQAWARITNLSTECNGRKVVVRRDNGKYMTCAHGQNGWSDDRERAWVFDYTADGIGLQLQEVEIRYGAKWTAEVVDG